MSSFEINFGQHALSGHPSPAQSGNLQMRIQYRGEPIELTSIAFSIQLDRSPVQIWPEQFQSIQPITSSITPWDRYIALRIPLDAVRVSFIERIRQGGGPLSFSVYVKFFYHRLIAASQLVSESQASPLYMLGSSETQQAQAICTVQRDEWLEVLKIIGWQEFEIFEIPTVPLLRHERFIKALDLLNKAKEAFRAGEYDTCIVRARSALEAAAATTGEDGNKQAFTQLWKQVLPSDTDEPKRLTLDFFANGVGKLRHPVAHGDIHFQLRRSDAELVLTVTVSLLRYIGEELERTSTAG
jgi:hypothetical protein